MAEKSEAFGFKTVPNGEEKCIWMEAGVIDYKLCNNYYNCHTCTFDKGMKQTADKNGLARLLGKEPEGKKGNIVAWQAKMKKRQGPERKCRHTLTSRAPMRLCPYDYECHSCAFDQMLEDGLELQLPFHMSSIPQVDGYGLPDGHFFHVGHAWARIEAGGRIRVGLDDFSMRLFGPVDSIDLPLTGEEVKFSEIGLEFKRLGHEAAVMAPISGIVTAVNHQVAKDPTLVKEEPYNEGWLMVLDPTDMKKNLKDLLYGRQSVEWIQAEHQKLVEMISEVGMTYADGGYVEDVFGQAPKIGWERLRQSFLRT